MSKPPPKEIIKSFSDVDKLSKITFWIPADLKLEYLSKCVEFGLGSQTLLSGLLFLLSENNEDLSRAIKKINRFAYDREVTRKGNKGVTTIGNERKAKKERANLFNAMTQEELEEFFEVSEKDLEEHLFKKHK